MQLLLFIPVFLLMLYSLYKFTKDDYIFIRRNISLEQMFDIAFTVLWSSLFFSRAVYFLYHPIQGKNIFLEFFTPNVGGFSLIGAVIGGMLGLYLVSKYKRVPLGRLFDFFTLSFMISLPLGFLLNAVLIQGYVLVVSLACAVIFLSFILIFMKLLYPKLLNRTMREGSISIFFVLLFSLVSTITSLINTTNGISLQLSLQSVLPTILFIFSIGLLIKQERSKLKARKYK